MTSQCSYPRDETVHALVAAFSASRPDAIALAAALVTHDRSDTTPGAGQAPALGTWTYAGLETASRRVAAALVRVGVGPGDRVAVAEPRSPDMIVGWLGVLRCGAAYVPVDPTFPDAALLGIVEDCCPRAVLAGPSADLARFGDRPVIDLHQALTDPTYDAASWTDADVSATDPAYVMYTSGSTGRPKGVVVSHRGIVRLVRDQNYHDFGRPQMFLSISPPGFDASTFEVWGALLNGHQVVVVPDGRLSLADIGEAIRRHGVTTLLLTAGLFQAVAEHDPTLLRGLRALMTGGDVVSPKAARRLLDALPGLVIVNCYGPTEATTISCAQILPQNLDPEEPIPIGRTVSHSRAYVVDPESLEPGAGPARAVQEGEVGELLVAGDGVAIGYLLRPELTEERFIVDPFAADGSRAYRTGDLARVRQDGAIDFLGRNDRQVKIDGKRIEMDEIEHALRLHDRVLDAAVVLDQAGSRKSIVAFLKPAVIDAGASVAAEVMADYRARMPSHMVPHEVHVTTSFPLMNNGKLDRRAMLHAVRGEQPAGPMEIGRLAASGQSDVETMVARLWQTGLGRSDFGLDQNFFECGGTSLALVTLHAKLEQELGRPIPLTDLFAHPTVRGLAKVLDGASGGAAGVAADAAARAAKQRAAVARVRLERRSPGEPSD